MLNKPLTYSEALALARAEVKKRAGGNNSQFVLGETKIAESEIDWDQHVPPTKNIEFEFGWLFFSYFPIPENADWKDYLGGTTFYFVVDKMRGDIHVLSRMFWTNSIRSYHEYAKSNKYHTHTFIEYEDSLSEEYHADIQLLEKLKVIDLSSPLFEKHPLFFQSYIAPGRKFPERLPQKFIAYLEGCKNNYPISWGIKSDGFGGEIEGPFSQSTDGVWAWTREYIHHLKLGTVGIPKSFMAHVQALNFRNKSYENTEFRIMENRFEKLDVLLGAEQFAKPLGEFTVLISNLISPTFEHMKVIDDGDFSQTWVFKEYEIFSTLREAILYSRKVIRENPKMDCWIIDKEKKLVDYVVDDVFLEKTLRRKAFSKFVSFFIPKRFKGFPA